MKFLFDLFPVIFFFITLKIAEKTATADIFLTKVFGTLGLTVSVKPDLVPIMLATIVITIASVMQIAWVKFKYGKVDKMLWLSALLVIVMGGMTLYFQNAIFIKWKPTILYWSFTITLICGKLFWQKNFIKTMLESSMELPEKVWATLNYLWAAFFLSLGFLNLYVAFNYSIDTWATFKLFGTMGIMIVFIVLQTLILSKYITPEDLKSDKKDAQGDPK